MNIAFYLNIRTQTNSTYECISAIYDMTITFPLWDSWQIYTSRAVQCHCPTFSALFRSESQIRLRI